MSFSKAVDLVKLAQMAAGRHAGISLSEVAEEFSCSYRTAQRMTRALEIAFPVVSTRIDDQQRKHWHMNQYDIRLLAAEGLRDTELVALEMSIRRAIREGVTNEAEALRRLRDRFLAALSRPAARRTESDAEALLEALGFACRPGPRAAVDEDVLIKITEALRGPHLLSINYGSVPTTADSSRLVEPYGLILGVRKYLAGKIHGGDGRVRHFRLDRITSMRVTTQSFNRCQNFSLEDHAARAFGSFHSEDEYGEVVWRFRADAATVARDFVFHPRQEFIEESDGSLLVKFRASGHLEMAWHLYCWGDAVEVLQPYSLRQMVSVHQRRDFQSLP